MYNLESQTENDRYLQRAGTRCPKCGGQLLLRAVKVVEQMFGWLCLLGAVFLMVLIIAVVVYGVIGIYQK